MNTGNRARNGNKNGINLLGFSQEYYQLMHELLQEFFQKYKLWNLINEIYYEIFGHPLAQDARLSREIFILVCSIINPPIIQNSTYDIKIVKIYLKEFFNLVRHNLPFRYFIEASRDSPKAQIYKILIHMLLLSMNRIAYAYAHNILYPGPIKITPQSTPESILSRFHEGITVLALNNRESNTFNINLPECGDCVTFFKEGSDIVVHFTELKINQKSAKTAIRGFNLLNRTNTNCKDVFASTKFNYQKKYFSSSIKKVDIDAKDLVFTFKHYVKENRCVSCFTPKSTCKELPDFQFKFPRSSYVSVLKLFRRDMKNLEIKLKSTDLSFNLDPNFTNFTWTTPNRKIGTVEPVNMADVNTNLNVSNSVLLGNFREPFRIVGYAKKKINSIPAHNRIAPNLSFGNIEPSRIKSLADYNSNEPHLIFGNIKNSEHWTPINNNSFFSFLNSK
jgi:hypothetical protein